MGVTYFSDVYPYGLAEIDDVRLDNLKSTDPALYLQRLWDYLRNAIPKFTAPKGIQVKLTDYVTPVFTDAKYQGDGTQTEFSTGANADYVCITDENGSSIAVIMPETSLTSGGVTYDAENGKITFDTAPNYAFYVDSYVDGYFNQELNETEKSILGIAFRIAWFSKIANTFLRTTPKIKDKNFNMDSSWGVEQADTARIKALRVELVDAMTDYENTVAYHVTVPSGNQLLNRV